MSDTYRDALRKAMIKEDNTRPRQKIPPPPPPPPRPSKGARGKK